MKTITLLHPFTPKAAGVVEQQVPIYHSQPHLNALQHLAKSLGYCCSMHYFTSKFLRYSKQVDAINYTFFPVTRTFSGDHKKWKKQSSKSCLRAYAKNAPDVTIINMSGHSSPFSYELSKVILKNKKQYIAMLGGQHYTDSVENRDYYENAHHILVHTTIQKKTMETMPQFKGLDIRTFPLGVNCNIFKPIKQKHFTDNPILLYVGRIVELKRIHLAIIALKTLKEQGYKHAKLNIIGPVSSEGYLKTLEAMVIDFKLHDNVFFLGHKSYLELPKYYQESHLFVLPSTHESFGMVMIEAMACGTPVVAIENSGGPVDVISHLHDGILSTPENYTDEILSLFKQPKLLETMSVNARQKVLDAYSLEATYTVLKTSVEEITALL